MKYGNSLTVLTVFVLAVLVLHGCDSADDSDVSNTDYEASAEFSYTIDVTNHTTMRVDALNGTVVIRAIPNAGSVVIAGERRVGSESLADARDFLRRLIVNVAESGDEIVARTEQPSDAGGRECIVDYDVTIPADMEINIDHINGIVVLDDIESDTYVDLINGTLTSSIDLPIDGTVDMTVINGTMTLEIPTATSAHLTAAVTNGQLHVSNLDFTSQHETDQSISGVLGVGDGSIRLTVINGILDLKGR
jgi:hypothetical protein